MQGLLDFSSTVLSLLGLLVLETVIVDSLLHELAVVCTIRAGHCLEEGTVVGSGLWLVRIGLG